MHEVYREAIRLRLCAHTHHTALQVVVVRTEAHGELTAVAAPAGIVAAVGGVEVHAHIIAVLLQRGIRLQGRAPGGYRNTAVEVYAALQLQGETPARLGAVVSAPVSIGIQLAALAV